MMKVIIVSHGGLAKAILESAEMIVGKIDDVTTLGLYQGESIENISLKLEKELLASEELEETLVLTDMYFGSPFNIATSLGQKYNFRHITGFNLPVLIEILTSMGHVSCDQLVKNIMEKQTIIDVNSYLIDINSYLQNDESR